MATIVLIEDNRLNARLIRKILEGQNHTILHAASGVEGLRMAQYEDPDLILLDISLPDLDGRTIARRLQSLPATNHIPIIAVSAHDSSATRHMIEVHGVRAFVRKPISIQELLEKVSEVLDTVPLEPVVAR